MGTTSGISRRHSARWPIKWPARVCRDARGPFSMHRNEQSRARCRSLRSGPSRLPSRSNAPWKDSPNPALELADQGAQAAPTTRATTPSSAPSSIAGAPAPSPPDELTTTRTSAQINRPVAADMVRGLCGAVDIAHVECERLSRGSSLVVGARRSRVQRAAACSTTGEVPCLRHHAGTRRTPRRP